jgi:hypothetical protein
MATVIYNNIIPFKGYKAITILPFIFARNSAKWLKDYEENHEKIHLRQQLEVLIASAVILAALILIFGWSWWWMLTSLFVYYAGYGIDYAIRYVAYGSPHEAYRNIAVEQEAYLNERDMTYLNQRKLFAWVEYIGKQSFRK